MIVSGVFLVDADIARTANSPALVLGAWVVTGVLTMIGALSYGELAAMMPKAGGQYVYLRESLGPLWGFLYGWTLFLVIQTGTIAAVCVAFGKFLGVFFPTISTTHWLWHIAHVPGISIGPMVLGNMEIGVNTANLTGIVIVFLLAFVNMFGVKLGSMIQNIFTSAKALSLAALVEKCRMEFAAPGAGRCRRPHCAGEFAGDPRSRSGRVAVFRGRLEQHHVHGRRSKKSAAQHSTVAGPRHRLCADGLFSGDAGIFAGPADARRYARNYNDGARVAVCV